MGLPQDLKGFTERDSFSLFTPDEALAILVCLLFICWLADRMGVWS